MSHLSLVAHLVLLFLLATPYKAEQLEVVASVQISWISSRGMFSQFHETTKKKENIQITRLNDFCKQTQTLPESSPFFFLLFLGREEANIRKQFSSLDGDHTEIGKFGPMDGSVASFLFLRLEPLGCIETKPLWITNDNSGHQKIVAPKLFLGEGLKTKRTVVFRCFLGWSFQMPRCPRRASCDTDLLRRNDAKQSCTEYNNIHKSNKYNTSKGILVYSPIPRVSHVCVFPFGFPSIKMFVKVPTSGGFSEILSFWTSMEFWYTSSILRAEGMDALMMSWYESWYELVWSGSNMDEMQ